MKILTKQELASGGGTKTYIGKLDNGQYYAYFEGSLGIYDEDYMESFKTPNPYLWEKKHRIAVYDLDKYKEISELADEFN